MKQRLIFLVITFSMVMSIGLSLAQSTCPQLVEQALTSMGDNCETLGRNTACYGYSLVSAQFAQQVEDNFFSSPADVTNLDILESIQTSEMNIDQSIWGVALMNIQANIPNSIPGQAVKFVLLGDVAVESAVTAEQSFDYVDPITVTVTGNANIRSGAGLNFNVVAGLAANESIQVDGRSADGLWYRVIDNNRVGWIFGELLTADDQLATLPVLDGTQRSLMQAFYLRTGVGVPACEEAPNDTLIIQGPQQIEIDLSINGADIRIGSTIAVRILPPGDVIEFTVIEGKMTIPGAGLNGTDLIVYENYRTTACLDEPDDIGLDGNSNDREISCAFSTPQFVPELDLVQAFCILEEIPATLLNYAVDLQCPDETVIQSDVPVGGQPSAPSVATDEPADTPNDNNLCYEGNTWGDGRCQTDYDWQAGYYYGQLEAGLIRLEDIPEPFYIAPTPIPTTTGGGSSGGSGISASIGCGISTSEYEVVVNKLPSTDTGATIYYTPVSGTSTSAGNISLPLPQSVNFFSFLPVDEFKVVSEPSMAERTFGGRNCP